MGVDGLREVLEFNEGPLSINLRINRKPIVSHNILERKDAPVIVVREKKNYKLKMACNF